MGSYAPHLQPILALVAVEYLVGVYAHCPLSASPHTMHRFPTYSRGKGSQTPARVRCMSMPPSVAVPLSFQVLGGRGACACGLTHVYLAILEALLQVLVDRLVGNLADQGEI